MMDYINNGKHTRKKALGMGYTEVPDENAYSGAYYIKNGLKWIFNIQGLKKDLGVVSNEQLSQENYDIETYFKLENEPENIEMKQVYQDLEVESGEPVYLEGGMYLYPDGSIR